jgi:hypothetical protein
MRTCVVFTPPRLAKNPNLRRKPYLIARRTVHHCAPLHLARLPLVVAARNDVRLDAQSRTVSSAHWLRLAGAFDAGF